MADESSLTIRLLVTFQIVVGFVTMYAAYRHVEGLNATFDKASTAEGRIVLTLRYLAISFVPVALSMWTVVASRGMTSAINPLSGNDHLIQKKNRILVNSLEQFVFHACVMLAYCTFLDETTFKFIPLLCGLFIVGRVLFAFGYAIHYMARLYGFVLTFYSSLFVLFHVVWKLASSGELGIMFLAPSKGYSARS